MQLGQLIWLTERSLEVKLPTMLTDEAAEVGRVREEKRREDKRRKRREDQRRKREEKESEGGRSNCANR